MTQHTVVDGLVGTLKSGCTSALPDVLKEPRSCLSSFNDPKQAYLPLLSAKLQSDENRRKKTMPMLIWCEDCGEDFEGWGEYCEKCDQELCYKCYHEHLKECPNCDDEESKGWPKWNR